MILIISSIYIVFLLSFVLTSIFIVYHLRTYSINMKLTFPLLVIFIVVTTALFFTNLLLFANIDWGLLLKNL